MRNLTGFYTSWGVRSFGASDLLQAAGQGIQVPGPRFTPALRCVFLTCSTPLKTYETLKSTESLLKVGLHCTCTFKFFFPMWLFFPLSFFFLWISIFFLIYCLLLFIFILHGHPLFSMLLINYCHSSLPCYHLILDHPLYLQSSSVADPVVKLVCLFKTRASFQQTQCYLFLLFFFFSPTSKERPKQILQVFPCSSAFRALSLFLFLWVWVFFFFFSYWQNLKVLPM